MTWLRRSLLPLLLIFGGAAGFVIAVDHLSERPVRRTDSKMLVVIPPVLQLVMAGGDRYLAADLATIRTLTGMPINGNSDDYAVQATVQRDIAWLNPRHEDNYYLAAGTLAWSGHTEIANEILEQAAKTRPQDFMPPLFLGFNAYYFGRNPAAGARWMSEAGSRSGDEHNRAALQRIASRWAEKGDDPKAALALVKMMVSQARSATLRKSLEIRAERLEGLILLREAASRYQLQFGRVPSALNDLVRSHMLQALPSDPLGLGYELNASGQPGLVTPKGAQR